MSCDVGKATEGLENELWRRWTGLILQPFRHFTYVTAYSPTLPSLYLRHSSFSNPSVASPSFACTTSRALRLRHLTSRPWSEHCKTGNAGRSVICVNSRKQNWSRRARWLRGNARDSHLGGPKVQIPWPANLVEVFSGFLYLKITNSLVIFKDECRVGPHFPLQKCIF